MKTNLSIKGMHCSSCKVLIEDVCSEIAGVESCTVDVKTGAATVTHAGTLSPSALKKQLREKLASLGEYRVA